MSRTNQLEDEDNSVLTDAIHNKFLHKFYIQMCAYKTFAQILVLRIENAQQHPQMACLYPEALQMLLKLEDKAWLPI